MKRKVIITIEDLDDENVNIRTDFEPALNKDEKDCSPATSCAIQFLDMINKQK